MKKIVSLLMAGAMLMSCMSACAVNDAPAAYENITVASSDADTYADWLSARLGTITENVVLGIGDAEKYGIDMSDFEDDGYIIRNIGDATAVFGKTEDALDAAVRKYANAVEVGESVEEITYHEGYRIDKFTLLGRDISEYKIIHSTDANENMTFAASELQRLLEIACGVTLPIVISDEDEPCAIILRHTDDETLEIGGYRYFSENGALTIEGAVREGVLNGVYKFLEDECGWEYLFFGDSELAETDHLVIGEDVQGENVPAFEFFHVSTQKTPVLPSGSDRTFIESFTSKYYSTYSYPVRHANHGLEKNNWANFNPHFVQICYTNPAHVDTVVTRVTEHLLAKEEAGDIIGETVRFIDIAQGDNGRYCMCETCCVVLEEELSHTGAVVRFANEVATQVNELFPGTDLEFLVFAYFNAFAPPAVTAPNEWVNVSYAPNGSCANHKVDGSECDPDVITDFDTTGVEFGEYLKGWCNISDNIYVWYYQITMNFNYHTIWDVLYEDMRTMHDIGVRGVYFFGYPRGWGLKRVEQSLAYSLLWNIDMTWEEYMEEYHRVLEAEFGDGWEFVEAHLELCKEGENNNCWSCWSYADLMAGIEIYDLAFVADNFEKSIELLDKAVERAGDAMQVELCERQLIEVIYRGCYASYFTAYNAGDEERLTELAAYYDRMVELLNKYGIGTEKIPNLVKFTIADNIEDEAFTHWIDGRDRLPAGDYPERPIPEEYIPETTVTDTSAETATIE